MYYLVFFVGWVFARIPEWAARAFCHGVGHLFFWFPSKRRNLIYSNLHHAFPERSPEWLHRTVRRVCIRTAEMGLFTLAVPHFSMQRFLRCLEVTPEQKRFAESMAARGRPVLLFGMHFSMLEATNAWPALAGVAFKQTAVMYRPNRNARIDAMVKRHRERAGFRLVSRKEGIQVITEVMRNNGVAALLFDQNTREQGTLIPFFGRVTAATELHGLLAKKYDASMVMILPQRIAFWRARVEFEELCCEKNPAEITLASNRWLEQKLRSDEECLIDWLWTHNRWKILFRPFERLGMNHRKKLVDFSSYPVRKTRIAVLHQHLGEWPTQGIRFLKALRYSRPDAEITLITRDAEGLQTQWSSWVDVAHNLFDDTRSNRQLACALRDRYLDVLLVLDDTSFSRKFAAHTRIPQRFGVTMRLMKRVSGLTDSWTPKDTGQWQKEPDWIAFGRHFGLECDEHVAD